MGGYKTPASATTAYLNARKKLMGDAQPSAGTGATSTTSAPATPKSTGKKRAATKTPADGSTKKRGRKSKAEMQAAANGDGDDTETKTTKIKGEADVDEDDDTIEKVLSGAQDLVDGDGDGEDKVEKTEDA